MAEMPFDVLNERLGKIRDNGDIDFDNTAAAVSIDEELQSKFLFFPIEEIDAIEIEHSNVLSAGSGPENCQASEGENPNWLYNHALNALALYRHLSKKEQEEKKKLESRPAPGVYFGFDVDCNFIAIVTEDRRVLVPQEDSSRTIKDCTEDYDTAETGWDLQRIDLTDGTVQA